MHDARDADDRRRLEEGDHKGLVESYYGVILDRCRARLRREDEAIAVAGEVAIRLLSELARGRRYRVPFRVVVHQVTTWKLKEHFSPGRVAEVGLDEWLERAASDASSGLEDDSAFEALLAALTELEQLVLRLRYQERLEIPEIAERIGRKPNAVHQIHHRALVKLRREAT
jgi:RNA polymerase sigma factor (sigma-70 family)